MPTDFTDYYHQEKYLFERVGPRFTSTGQLSAFDFFCIVIWKANRAKSKVASRLKSRGKSDLESAVAALTKQIAAAESNRARLSVLIDTWGFRLPMASAILTVLYPEEFTVYDVRVCDILGDFHDAQNRTFPRLWERYSDYIDRVRASVPSKASLRDKDRYLWGRSFAEQLSRDISTGFGKTIEAYGSATAPVVTSADIGRDAATLIAKKEVAARGSGTRIRHVYLLEELPFRAPNFYGGPDLTRCWIAYVERPLIGLRSSIVVLVDRFTGDVLYHGDAHDEG